MNKIFVDLGMTTVGVITHSGQECEYHYLTILEGSSVEEGAYQPPQHIWINNEALIRLYLALKAILDPPVEG